eukprot:5435625-Prymnesium_polylepis.1
MIRTDRPTPGTLALIGDGRASLSHIVPWVDHTSYILEGAARSAPPPSSLMQDGIFPGRGGHA